MINLLHFIKITELKITQMKYGIKIDIIDKKVFTSSLSILQ